MTRSVAICACLTLLAACNGFTAARMPAPTPPVPSGTTPPASSPTVAAPSAKSEELARYYQRLQNELLTQGLLRGDGGGSDTPFTDTLLARNFVRIALFNEYRDDSDFLTPRATLSKLRRWDQPIRMSVQFGDTVPLLQRDMDRASVSSYAARLSRLSGIPISMDDENPNFSVYFLGEDDRLGFEDELRRIIPNISDATVRTVINLPRDQLCFVIGTFEPGQSTYRQAVALIRAEHPNLMRSACIHEELAQGMGLANDSPVARPSIFNDDEEFALLTRHDELLIRMLYDRRLQPGMSPATAAPIARQIARDLLAGGAS
ncbi:DUF2927 domain-containing protein [Yoonia sp.]|uniref:DUF2927 domain-containing protein n=1 Tax=Yoonia sp. TaxID=2212373 RepID=UPI003F6D9D39